MKKYIEHDYYPLDQKTEVPMTPQVRRIAFLPTDRTTTTVLHIFFDTYCGTNGTAPTCNGCAYWCRTPCGIVCTHPEHPENKQAYREMAGRF